MDSLKSEFQRDIIDFINSQSLNEILKVLIQNWVGCKITDASLTLESFVNDTLKREFKFETAFCTYSAYKISERNLYINCTVCNCTFSKKNLA